MHYFLFVRTEGGVVEMASLGALEREDAIAEAGKLPFAGRPGSLFQGDEYIGEVATADTFRSQTPLGLAADQVKPGSLTDTGPTEAMSLLKPTVEPRMAPSR